MNYRRNYWRRGRRFYFHAWTPDGWRRVALGFAIHRMHSAASAAEQNVTRGFAISLQLGPMIVGVSTSRALEQVF